MMRTLLVAAFVCSACAFYMPGVTPRTFAKGDQVKIRVNRLTSSKTLLPFDYYELPFPRPHKGVIEQPENLGEYLTGVRIENSGYHVYFQDNKDCQYLARSEYTKEDIRKFQDYIVMDYHVHWIVDNLPSAAAIDDYDAKTQTVVYDLGFPVGKRHMGDIWLYNHAKMTVLYHSPKDLKGNVDPSKGRIVGFLVEPLSIKHKYSGKWDESQGADQLTSCRRGGSQPSMDSSRAPMIITDDDREVIWTYDVDWKSSKIVWASRWDTYLSMGGRYDDEVHWFSICSALMIVFLLGGIVGLILVRAIRRDIAHYNRIMTEEEREEAREESGWKLVHGDVFRPPSTMPGFFCVLNGSGVQLFFMSGVVILLSAIGFISPSRRGSVVTWFLLTFVGSGMSAGYTSARLNKYFKGADWTLPVKLTAFFVPGVFFGLSFILNLIVWAEGSVRAIPFGSMVVVACLWFLVSVPLVFAGARAGYVSAVPEPPVRVSKTARPIPEQDIYWSTPVAIIIGGMLPFGAVFVELFFIFSSIWLDQYYYVFGFLLLTWIIMLATCAEVSIVFCYFQLCNEDYHWWWRSFITGGSVAAYVFMYSVFFFFKQMDTIFFTTTILYFTYSAIIAGALFLICGTVGFHVCLWFISKIYTFVKVD
jgi:transmembrane 9 superfamily protein 2/4